MKNQKRVKRKKFYVTSLVLPNYHAYKKDVNGYKNSSHCFPDDFITCTPAAFSVCKENQKGKVKP